MSTKNIEKVKPKQKQLRPIAELEETEGKEQEEDLYEEKHYIDFDINSPYCKKALSYMYKTKAYEKEVDEFMGVMMDYWEAERNTQLDRAKQTFDEITRICRGMMKDLVISDEWKEACSKAEDEKKCTECFFDLVENNKRARLTDK